MAEIYQIPLQYQKGKYPYCELPETDADCLVLYPDGGQTFRYTDPVYQNEIRVYSIPEENPEQKLTAGYSDSGILEYVEVADGNSTRLVYIRFPDDESAKEIIYQFSKYEAQEIADKIMSLHQEFSRIFIEYFFDGQSADIAVRTGTPEEMQEIKEYYQKNHPRIAQKVTVEDDAGAYPFENRIEFDSETFSMMLRCTRNEFKNELFGFSVWILEQKIQEILPWIQKTDDFKFLSEEYD
ncbi:MAG: hypothetical protein IJ644_02770 [Oscillospiraceae bacterium]|nr:hypothetical protein [Oscillospiraceae bacterium]